MVLGHWPPTMPNGHVLKEHVEEMRDLLSEGFGDPNHEYEHVVTYTMQQWIRVIQFLQDMFEDNPYWSKLLAKAHASILAVADNLLQDTDPGHPIQELQPLQQLFHCDAF